MDDIDLDFDFSPEGINRRYRQRQWDAAPVGDDAESVWADDF
jgi:hypothetical protein